MTRPGDLPRQGEAGKIAGWRYESKTAYCPESPSYRFATFNPISFIRIWMSAQTSFFAGGLRSTYAGW